MIYVKSGDKGGQHGTAPRTFPTTAAAAGAFTRQFRCHTHWLPAGIHVLRCAPSFSWFSFFLGTDVAGSSTVACSSGRWNLHPLSARVAAFELSFALTPRNLHVAGKRRRSRPQSAWSGLAYDVLEMGAQEFGVEVSTSRIFVRAARGPKAIPWRISECKELGWDS